MRELALFAGAGGGILGGKLLGWRTRCAVEFATYPRKVLLARQRDGYLEPFPIWDDVCTFDGRPWAGHIDVITGGFPCQDISAARGKGAKGLGGEKSGLWREYARIIGEVKPKFIFAENSPNLRTRGLVTVLKDLDRLGYDAQWGVLGGGDIGAAHRRDRMWVVAKCRRPDSGESPREVSGVSQSEPATDAPGIGLLRQSDNKAAWVWEGPHGEPKLCSWWPMARVPRVVDGVANGLDRNRAVGNGQIPGVAALAWQILSNFGD